MGDSSFLIGLAIGGLLRWFVVLIWKSGQCLSLARAFCCVREYEQIVLADEGGKARKNARACGVGKVALAEESGIRPKAGLPYGPVWWQLGMGL